MSLWCMRAQRNVEMSLVEHGMMPFGMLLTETFQMTSIPRTAFLGLHAREPEFQEDHSKKIIPKRCIPDR